MKRISWKSINSWVCFGLLLAPGLYLFGGYIGQLAGSNGEFMYAEPAIEGGVNYSVEYRNHKYQRYMYNTNTYLEFNDSESNFAMGYLEDNQTDIYVYNPNNCLEVAEEVTLISYDYPDGFFSWATGDYDHESLPYNACVAFIYEDIDNNRTTYWEFYSNDEPACWIFDENLVEDRMLNEGEADTSLLKITDYSHIYFSEEIYKYWKNGNELIFTTPRNIPETQPRIESAPAIEQNAQGNTEFQQGQFFSRNNFLKKWGDSVVSQEETWGFAPFKALIQYLDENMLHFESNGVQYGLMAYGYMYYALHIVLLDLVFYITSFLPRILKKLAERLEGGLE